MADNRKYILLLFCLSSLFSTLSLCTMAQDFYVTPKPQSPLSIDSLQNQGIIPEDTERAGYNQAVQELNLWGLESYKFFRSPVVVSPSGDAMAYTETTFMGKDRQTFARAYMVEFRPFNDPVAKLPTELNPQRTLKQRKLLAHTGDDVHHPFAFQTYTVIDWSESGKRLLLKRRTGVLHVGLITTDVLVVDRQKETTTLHTRLQEIVRHFWKEQDPTLGINLDEQAWEIIPLGWVPGSDKAILFQGWAFGKTGDSKKSKLFLGLWQYDIDANQSALLTLDSNAPPPKVATNGVVIKSY